MRDSSQPHLPRFPFLYRTTRRLIAPPINGLALRNEDSARGSSPTGMNLYGLWLSVYPVQHIHGGSSLDFQATIQIVPSPIMALDSLTPYTTVPGRYRKIQVTSSWPTFRLLPTVLALLAPLPRSCYRLVLSSHLSLDMLQHHVSLSMFNIVDFKQYFHSCPLSLNS